MKGKVPVLPQGVRPEGEAERMVTESPPGDAPRIAAEPGTLLSHYRVVPEIGRGGMGIVYEAVQESLGRQVALKVLPRQLVGDASRQARFEREARAAARLHHTNIVPVFGVGDEGGLHYYAMQYIRGQGLDEVLKELRSQRDASSSPRAAEDQHRGMSPEARAPSRAGLAGARREVTVSLTRALRTGQFEPLRVGCGQSKAEPHSVHLTKLQVPGTYRNRSRTSANKGADSSQSQ